MKTGWVTKHLGDLGEIVRGKGIRRSETVAKGKPCLRYGEIYTNFNYVLDEPCSFVPEQIYRECPHIKHGDVVFSLTGENKEEIAKALAYLGEDEVAAGGDLAIWTNHGCDAKFLAYIMYAPAMIAAKAHASNGDIIVHASVKKMQQIEIPLPPLAEQKRIVAKIDAAFEKIDKLKANAERNLANAKELFQSALNEAMRPKPGWVEKRLGEVCEITSVLVDPTEKIYSKFLHVGGANIVSNTGELVELKSAEEEKLRSGKFCFDSTMVLYNKIRPYLKKVARPDFAGLCSADMYPLVPTEGIDRDYLYYVLLSDGFTSYAMANSERAGMPKLNRAALFGYSACWPKSKGEQSQVAKTLDALACSCTRLQSNYTRLIADCAEMRQAVLKEAFEGRL